jgi:hypothetical protein
MRFAYADPPYLGMGKMYLTRHPEAMIWNDPETHRALIKRLCDEWPDGWAMSATSTSLRILLPMCPDDVRVMAWCKTWAKFLPGISPAYAWEPVLLRGGRRIGRKDHYEPGENTPRDWHHGNHSPRVNKPEGFVPGMKPREFSRWLFRCLNALPSDHLDDLFPGSGAVGAAWAEWSKTRSPMPALPLEAVQ